MDEEVTSFRTKRGRCVLDNEAGELRLTSSWRGQFRRYYEGNTLVFVGMVLVLGYLPVVLISLERRTLLVGLGLLLVLLVGGRLSNYVRGFTSAHRIPLDSVVAIEPIEGSPVTRPRFVVSYSEAGTVKRRYVMLPSRYLSYTGEEFGEAKSLFRGHDLPVEPS
ncbi:hypothetical protein [Halococcus hamelinensis]|uniref:Uncharacterized protein n=1 Tax=Halococcus hamelinensis 100A6 TaxID=1132509 RepID=M0LWZ4_9EURY|nr:hypothetical protein [Halococcus hamelinensis]EMA38087.1 hypothetical protein C447_10170 [Halococcus hamelinensis 100A6]